MIDMSGWASVGSCACGSRSCQWCGGLPVNGDAPWVPTIDEMSREMRPAREDLPTLDELLEIREEGRRTREHYQREIRRMRALTPEEWAARVR